jgi:hypothetical protein
VERGSGGSLKAPETRAARVRVAASFLSISFFFFFFSFSLGFSGALAHHGLQAHEKEENVSEPVEEAHLP